MENVLVTGANRGIGFEFVRQYLAAGNRVIAACRHPKQATELKSLLRTNPALEIHELEVTDGDSVQALARSLQDQVIDVLINNAGIQGGPQGAKDMDYDSWSETFAVNTMSPLRVTMALMPNLRMSSRPRVITLSSQMGSLQRKSSGFYAYRSSKAAVNKVMQALAQELQADGVIVCPVHPGWVQTDMGGAQATLTPQESVAGLVRLIEGLTMAYSGRFFQWNGEEHPW